MRYSSDVPKTIESTDTRGIAFLIGQDTEGHWLAVETSGLRGGIFVNKDAALSYAKFETDRRAGAILLAAGPLHLT